MQKHLGPLWIAMLAVLGCLGCPGGGPAVPVVDSESHWLEECVSSATCGVFDCVCGVCTVPCIDDCGGTAVCAPAPEGCEVAAGGLCTARCGSDRDCGGEHLACTDGLCLPIASPAGDGGLPPPDATPGDMSPIPDVLVDGGALDMGPDGDIDAMADAEPGDMSPDPDMMPAPDLAPAPDMGPPDMAPPMEGECSHPDSECFADGQCPDGVCSAALPGGPCVCVAPGPPVERVMCGEGACCEDVDCPADDGVVRRCQAEGLDPQNQACGAMPAANVCVGEACARDEDCGAGKTCIRPGEYGHAISACVDATCATDDDCVARDEGQCTPFFTACFVRGFHCTYLGDACRVDADCPERGAPKVCLPLDNGRGTECREIE